MAASVRIQRMWVNTCWGLLGLSATCAVGGLPLLWTPGHEIWGPRLFYLAAILFVCSVVCFCWPLRKHLGSLPRVLWPFGYLPIDLAAMLTYQRTLHSGAAGWARTIRQGGGASIEAQFSKVLAEDTSIPIFGKLPLTKDFQEIPKPTFDDYRITFQGDKLNHKEHQASLFEGVSIKRVDLAKAIREINAKPA